MTMFIIGVIFICLGTGLFVYCAIQPSYNDKFKQIIVQLIHDLDPIVDKAKEAGIFNEEAQQIVREGFTKLLKQRLPQKIKDKIDKEYGNYVEFAHIIKELYIAERKQNKNK